MTAWVGDWLRAFGLTVAAELIVAVPLLRPGEPRPARRAALVVLANLATHPLVWFLFPGLAVGYAPRLALSEVFAVAVEGAAYAVMLPALGPRRAALVSLLANALSLGLGVLLRAAHAMP